MPRATKTPGCLCGSCRISYQRYSDLVSGYKHGTHDYHFLAAFCAWPSTSSTAIPTASWCTPDPSGCASSSVAETAYITLAHSPHWIPAFARVHTPTSASGWAASSASRKSSSTSVAASASTSGCSESHNVKIVPVVCDLHCFRMPSKFGRRALDFG